MLKNEVKQYIFALALSCIITGILIIYNGLEQKQLNLYIVNKILAVNAALMLALDLLIGPASRTFHGAAKYLQFRKEIGILGFYAALAHGIISLLLLPEIFPLSRFFGSINIPFIFGASSLIILTILFIISNEKITNTLGRKTWWHIQYLGVRSSFLFLFLHFVIMKYETWREWYIEMIYYKESTILPSAALITSWILLYVMIIRVFDYGIKKQKKNILANNNNHIRNNHHRYFLYRNTVK